MTTHPHAIAAESFAIIRRGLAERGHAFDPPLAAVIERIVHSTADFEFADLVRTSPGAVEAGVDALRAGCAVLTDVHMVRVGVNAGRLAALGGSLHCLIDDPEVQAFAAASGVTRGAQSMRLAAERGLLEGAIVAIGNAPTALEEVIRLVAMGARPALIVGVPVGFVGAAESKAALAEVTAVPWLITSGRKGGSTVAVAVINALLRLAAGAGNDAL
ncbi:MAG: precorrin-8X methylmutase [Oscillochloridaceae bacterium]|nr:precorrin-8X methylmutase [Chloroflexaceae bacterium]MDW8391312.1 precorrin-8X methylmutase [Oscillochloridaceae bacterium]